METDGSDDGGIEATAHDESFALRPFVIDGEVLDDTPQGRILLLRQTLEALVVAAGSPDALRDLDAMLAERLSPPRFGISVEFRLVDLAEALMHQTLPYSDDDLRAILVLLVDGGIRRNMALPLLTRFIRHVEHAAQTGGLSAALRPPLARERERLRPYGGANRYGRLLLRLERLLEPEDAGVPEPGEPWALTMRSFLDSTSVDSHARWRALLAHAVAVDQTRPSAKWLRAARAQVDAVSETAFRMRVLAWLRAAAEPSDRVLSERNGTILKGLAWISSTVDDAETSRVLATLAEGLLHWLHPRLDWRGLKAGNACLNALAMMSDPEALLQLVRLAQKLKGRQLQTSVNRAVEASIDRRGLSREDVEELLVPTHGLDADGCLREEIGGIAVELVVGAAGGPAWCWKVDGAVQPAVPSSIRSDHAAELRALRARAEEIRATLAAQRARLERLYLDERNWPLTDWCARYLVHPLLQPITRALIWEVETASGGLCLALPTGAGFEDVEGRPVRDLAGASVRLWHPLGADPDALEAWRRRMTAAGVAQPFKQVDREIYALSAEERAAAASARFGGRLLRQQQLSALCRDRGWQYILQGRWQGSGAYAVRSLPRWNLRAELLVPPVEGSGAGDLWTGAFAFVCTDVVRFRASDGGASLLTEVPERVISEVLRDVDLFASAAAVSAPAGDRAESAVPRRSDLAAQRRSRRQAARQQLRQLPEG